LTRSLHTHIPKPRSKHLAVLCSTSLRLFQIVVSPAQRAVHSASPALKIVESAPSARLLPAHYGKYPICSLYEETSQLTGQRGFTSTNKGRVPVPRISLVPGSLRPEPCRQTRTKMPQVTAQYRGYRGPGPRLDADQRECAVQTPDRQQEGHLPPAA
jgi:hypothetical protein